MEASFVNEFKTINKKMFFYTVGATGAYDKLHPEPPLINLFSIGPILTLILQTGIQAAAQVFVYLNVQTQPW